MTFAILGNLEQEAVWGRTQLPAHVGRRVAAVASLLAVLAPDDEPVAIYTAFPVEPGRLGRAPGWTPPEMRTSARDYYDLLWADHTAREVNDRRFALAVAERAGCALPGARVITTLDELVAHLAAGGAAASANRTWVCKVPWTSAGRDRYLGTGTVLAGEARAPLLELLARSGALVFEPWLPRLADVAICAHVERAGRVVIQPPHQLLTTERGTFRGIDLATRVLEGAEHDILVMTAEIVGVALHQAGYVGPFGVDAFVYDAAGTRRLHPLCEINARYTFGHVARALSKRLGIRALGMGIDPPAGSIVLVAPSRQDRSAAWVTSGA